MKYLVKDNIKIPLIGFGTWTIGDNPKDEEKEINTFLYGIDKHSMTLIDTAEMYGSGKSETVVGKLIKRTERNKLFIVDKILPNHAKEGKYLECCQRSLKLLGVDYIDLYLLHWKANVDLQDMVNNMEALVEKGLIKHWGVSNFDVDAMEELFKCKNGNNCFCNQILYNVGVRGPEFDLIPWCEKHNVLFMAYSPLCNDKESRNAITQNKQFADVAKKEGLTPESLMLNFVIRKENIVAIFKTSNIEHLDNNLLNVFKELSKESIAQIDAAFPAPTKKVKLLAI